MFVERIGGWFLVVGFFLEGFWVEVVTDWDVSLFLICSIFVYLGFEFLEIWTLLLEFSFVFLGIWFIDVHAVVKWTAIYKSFGNLVYFWMLLVDDLFWLGCFFCFCFTVTDVGILMEKDIALGGWWLGFGWVEDFWMKGALFHLFLLFLTYTLHGLCFILLFAFGTLFIESHMAIFHIFIIWMIVILIIFLISS
jgi:hypothetical protein